MHTSASRKTRRQPEGAPPLLKVAAMLLLPLLVAAVASCDSNANPTPTAVSLEPYDLMPEGRPSGFTGRAVPDPKEVVEVKPAGQLPDFLSALTGKSAPRITAQYQGSVDHYDAYKYIPCYCGCAIYTTAHKNLAECFIKEMKADGSIAFTDHSTSCDQCQTAAQMTLDGLAQNKSLKDIRAEVHKELSYTQIWTDTPPVP